MNEQTTIEYQNLSEMESELNQLEKAFRDVPEQLVKELEQAWKLVIVDKKAILTGAYLNSVEARKFATGSPESAHQFAVTTDREHAIYQEDGIPSRPSYEARHILRDTLSGLEARNWVNEAYDRAISETLKSAK